MNPRPFLVVTPLGLEKKDELGRLIRTQGIQIARTRKIHDWAAISTPLYSRKKNGDRIIKASCYEAVWKELFKAGSAEIWILNDVDDYRKLVKAKSDLRNAIGSQKFRVSLCHQGQKQIITLNLHPFHVPDEDHLKREWNILAM